MALSPTGRYRVNVTGARGAVGITLNAIPEPGQYLVKAAGTDSRSYTAVTPPTTPENAVALTTLAGDTGATLVGYRGRSQAERNADFVSVMDYGADNTGVSDSTQAFADALAENDYIDVPAGTFLANIDLSNISSKTIRGAGRYSTFIRNFGAGPAIRLGNETAPCQLHKITDLAIIKRTSPSYPDIDGILIAGLDVSDSIQQEWHCFENLWIQGFRYGIHVQGKLIWTNFKNIHSTLCVDGIRFAPKNNVSQIQFDMCRFGGNSGHGAYFSKSVNDTFNAIKFNHCTFESNDLNAFRGTGSVGFSGLVFDTCYTEFNCSGIAAGSSDPKKASIYIDSGICIALIIDGSELYGNGASAVDYHVYVEDGVCSGRIGPNRNGSATIAAGRLPSGFIVEPQDGNTNNYILADGSFDLRQFTASENADSALTLTGVSGAPSGVARGIKQGDVVTMNLPTIVGESNATTATLTGVAEILRPQRTQVVPAFVQDSGGVGIVIGAAYIGTDGTISLATDAGGGGFAAAGTKGVREQTISWSMR